MAQQLTQTMASLETTDGCEDRQQPKIYAKKSMDRFGDDLCQLLLSYLSFEDWFQCESVSKQFQRTVFGSVDCIEINDRFMQQILKTTITETLATIAIKCPKIETIDCRRIRVSENREHIPEVLAIFRDNCLNLPEIYCNVWQNSGQTMPTIGPLMTRIRVIDDFIDTQSLTHCHRLSHLSVNCLSEVVDTSGQIMAKNLQQIVLNFYSHEHQLSAFVAHNQSLKCFVVENYIDLPEETLNALTAQLSRLPQLRELTLSLKVTDSQHSLTDSLRPIGVNCKQLKRLSLDFIYTENYEFNRKTFDWLRYYRRLKRLVLRIYVDIDDDVLDPLRHCRRLTHLNILLMSMNAKAVEIVCNNCPQLQYLYIHSAHSVIDTECLSHLSRLPALQTLVIESFNNFTISANDFSDLLSRCPKLKNIKTIQYYFPKFYCRQNKSSINLQLNAKHFG